MSLGLIPSIYKFFQYNLLKIDEIKSVDLFFNQFITDSTGETDARSNPRVLVEIEEFEPADDFTLGKMQNWECTVRLHLGIDITNTMYSGSELEDKNLMYLQTLDSIYKQLSFNSSANLPDDIRNDYIRIFQIERTNVLFAVNEGAIKVTELSYRCIVEDDTLVEVNKTGIVEDIEVDLEFNRQCQK